MNTGHTTSSTGSAVYSPEEVEGFQKDDGKAATAIVGLMAGIFTTGLVLYLFVSWWVVSGGKM